MADLIGKIPLPPTPTSELKKLDGLPPSTDSLANLGASAQNNILNPNVLAGHIALWVPEMTNWSVNYDAQGMSSCSQSWLAGSYALPLSGNSIGGGGGSGGGTGNGTGNLSTPLVVAGGTGIPMAIRQLLSWNRELFLPYNTLFDLDYNTNYNVALPTPQTSMGLSQAVPLVPIDIDLIPRPDLMDIHKEKELLEGTGPSLISVIGRVPAADKLWDDATGEIRDDKDYQSSIRRQLAVLDKGKIEHPEFRQVFPRIRSQMWQVNIKWGRDEYVNRFGVRYAKIEMKPSVRLQALKNVPIAIVPTNMEGQPNFPDLYKVVDTTKFPDAIQPIQEGEAILERITTGFPIRETLIEMKITYPFVSMAQLLAAGPFGNEDALSQAQGTNTKTAIVDPFNIPKGLFLGCVNLHSFLGYTRGRVLYNSCELRQVASPCTGYIGFQVTHEFLINPNMEWNQVRYNGAYDPIQKGNVTLTANSPASAWRTGYMVQMHTSPSQEVANGTTSKDKVYNPVYTVRFADPNAANDCAAQYPYPYKEFYKDKEDTGLLYYGYVGERGTKMTTTLKTQG